MPGVQALVFADDRVLNLKRRGEDAEAHFSQRNLAAEFLRQFGLDTVVVMVDVDEMRNDQNSGNHKNEDNANRDPQLTHDESPKGGSARMVIVNINITVHREAGKG